MNKKTTKCMVLIIAILMAITIANAQIISGLNLGDYRSNVTTFLTNKGYTVKRATSNVSEASGGLYAGIVLVYYNNNKLVTYIVGTNYYQCQDILANMLYKYGDPVWNGMYTWSLPGNKYCTASQTEGIYVFTAIDGNYTDYAT